MRLLILLAIGVIGCGGGEGSGHIVAMAPMDGGKDAPEGSTDSGTPDPFFGAQPGAFWGRCEDDCSELRIVLGLELGDWDPVACIPPDPSDMALALDGGSDELHCSFACQDREDLCWELGGRCTWKADWPVYEMCEPWE